MTETQEKRLKLLLAVLNNGRFQLDIHIFKQRWGIPQEGFGDLEKYQEWISTKNRSHLTLLADLERIISKSHMLKRDEVAVMLLVLYITLGKFKNLPVSIEPFSEIRLSGFLGYKEKVEYVPFLGLPMAKGILSVIDEYNDMLSVMNSSNVFEISANDTETSYLPAVPGNPGDRVYNTQRNIEDLIELGTASLHHTVAQIKDFTIKSYKDKNKHIDGGVLQTGMFAMNRGLYAIAEIYWLSIAKEIDTINKKRGLQLNKGLPLANAGVSQLAQDKVLDGLRNLFYALKDDEKVLIALQNPSSDPALNLVAADLYTQFEDRLAVRLKTILLNIGIPLETKLDIESTQTDLLTGLRPDKRLFLFYLLAEFFGVLENDKVSDDLLSRSILLRVLGGYAAWLEDLLKKKYVSNDMLYQLFESKVQLGTMQIASGYTSHTLDELQIKIDSVLGDLSSSNMLKNAKVTTLIRNFATHNFQTENHDFYQRSVEYFSRMIYLTLYLKSLNKI